MYYIYHIPGKKIGCSKEPKYRVKQQGYTQFEILEQYEDINIASEREIELQKQYGYKVDNCLYKISKQNRRKWTKTDSDKARVIMIKNGFFKEWYKKGNAARIKSVGKYDKKTNELICIYNSISDAARDIDRPNNTTTISSCCLGKRKSYMGFIWKYIE